MKLIKFQYIAKCFIFYTGVKSSKFVETPGLVIMFDPTFKFEHSFIDLLLKLDSELKKKFLGSSMFNIYIWIC